MIERIGLEATDAVASARDTVIAPHAWMFLAATGVVDHDDVPRDIVIQAGIELFLATADLGSPADVIESFLDNQSLDDHSRLLDDLARSDHPRTGELLELIGRHHPTKLIGKHARKLAHRWRSGHGSH